MCTYVPTTQLKKLNIANAVKSPLYIPSGITSSSFLGSHYPDLDINHSQAYLCTFLCRHIVYIVSNC